MSVGTGSGSCGGSFHIEQLSHDAEEILGVFSFGKETVGAGGVDFLDGLIGIVNGKDQDFCIRARPEDLSQGDESVEDGHVDVENHEVGAKRFHFSNCILSIYCFAANFQVRFGLQRVSNASTKHFMIVGNQNSFS